ncbi:hypothetical protein P885DRAFT_75515 [Corynascus similis CBS 632.67]
MSKKRWFGAPPTRRWATARKVVPKSSTTTKTASVISTSKAPTTRRAMYTARTSSYALAAMSTGCDWVTATSHTLKSF